METETTAGKYLFFERFETSIGLFFQRGKNLYLFNNEPCRRHPLVLSLVNRCFSFCILPGKESFYIVQCGMVSLKYNQFSVCFYPEKGKKMRHPAAPFLRLETLVLDLEGALIH